MRESVSGAYVIHSLTAPVSPGCGLSNLVQKKPKSQHPISFHFSKYNHGENHMLKNIVSSSLSGVPDFFDRNKILSGGDLSHYQVPHCIRVFFYFVWFVFIHHNFQFYFELCTYCNILDIYLS